MLRVAIVWLALAVACSPPPAQIVPSRTPSATVVALTASPTATPTSATTPTPSAPREDLAARFHPLVQAGWRPGGPIVVLETSNGIDASLVAVSVATPPSSPMPLATFAGYATWQLRADGTALAVSLQVSADTSRIATWDLITGALRWVTPDEPGVQVGGPVWSMDGASIYYGSSRPTPTSYTDLGILRIAVDGTGRTVIHGADANGGLPRSLTPDGRGLAWSRTRAGGSVDVVDLATGADRAFDPSAAGSAASWRAARPRVLVISGNCCAGYPGGALHLWDDIASTETVLLGPTVGPRLAVGAADWEPTGDRIAVVVYDRVNAPNISSIAILDPRSGARQAVAGTEGAVQVRWLPSGIVYNTSTFGGPNDLILIAPDGTSRTTLYHSTSRYPFGIAQVILP